MDGAGCLVCHLPFNVGFPLWIHPSIVCFDLFWLFLYYRRHPRSLSNPDVPASRSPGYALRRLIGWLAGWLAGWLVGWLDE